MKHYSLKILLIVICVSCITTLQARTPNDSIRQDCEDMMTFLKGCLFENYGDSLAFNEFWESHQKFNGNYILFVNRQELYELVQRSHNRTWNHFIIGMSLNEDSIDDNYWTERTIMNASAINPISIVPSILRKDTLSSTYYKKCLKEAKHPFLQHIYQHTKHSYQLNGYQMCTELFNKYNVFGDFRKDNQEIQLLITIYLWPYLCHCANIDVYSGKWRDELINHILLPE